MKDIADSRPHQRQDSMLLEEDLEHIDETLYEPMEEELVARTILSIYDQIPEGAEEYSYDKFTRQGSAKITPTGADDVPLVDNVKERVSQKVVSIENGFKIEKQELRAARDNGQDIDTDKAATARRIISEKENDLVFNGRSAIGVEGLVDADDIHTYTAPDGEGGDTEWEEKTGEEIVADIRNARAKINELDNFNADTLVVPGSQYEELEKPYNDYNAQTIMAYIDEQGWFDEIVASSYLEGENHDVGDDVGLVIDTDSDKIQIGLAIDMQREEPYRLPNGSYLVRVEERTCGTIIRRPKAICRIDGI